MDTKIVYCLVSNEQDFYLEQAWISIYSLRRFNPDATVILVVDVETKFSITGKRAGITKLVSEIVTLEAPGDYSPKEKSRYLKTNFRQFISGNLLYIDTDTVISGSLSDIDNETAEIACVPDYHVRFKEIPVYDILSKRVIDIFGINVDSAEFYFNSGVMYVKDTKMTRRFFSEWATKWEYSSFKKGCSFDQPALFATNQDAGYIIKELSGIYNCQILYSIQYLPSAKILHFFNTTAIEGLEELSPFYGREIYEYVKSKGEISGDVKSIIENPTKWIFSPSYFISKEQYKFLTSSVGVGLFSHFKTNSILYRILLKYCNRR